MPPIAILGLGCRFPRAPSPRAYWRLLRDEVDAIREVPPDRWDIDAWYSPEPGRPDKMTTRWGGFLDDLDQFDAEFFKITPREAAQMDPQQRLVLEVAHEALDDAGLPADRLAGSRTAVYIGVDRSDYAGLAARGGKIDPFWSTGGSLCVVSNRLSYLLDLRGPAMSIDTACSSSLVALHLAAQSLASGESELALVGAASALLSPSVTVAFSNAGFMAPDGRCKPFDARADGYVRGEGVGVVVLKPLDAALRDGDPIRAMLLGTAVNQDGRSNGLTAPNGLAQQAVIRAACIAAEIRPDELEYVEAHGTGTFLGDPIEAHALGAVLAPGRDPARPCALGSVKSNLGHLEAAAGIAGLIKVVLALEHRTVPASLHFATPNPHIAFAELGLAVQAHTAPWPCDRPHRIAGISSFGFGGTNAHVVVREAPRPVAARDEPPRAALVPLSAHSPRALEALAWSYLDELGAGGTLAETGLGAIARTAARHRTHHRFRLAVTARSRADLGAQLTAFLDGKLHDRIAIGRGAADPPPIAFVFSGQGTQWAGMGRQLIAEEPVFRAALDQVDAALARYLRRSITSLLVEDAPASGELPAELVPPAIFAIQLGLDAVWRSLGIAPAAIIGHSVGEIAAACAAGALTLDDAARVITARSRVLRGHQGRGRMLAASIDEADAERRCAALASQFPDDLAVAAVNGPHAVAFSGSPPAITALFDQLSRDNVPCAMIDGVDFASHGPQMTPLMDALTDAASGIAPRRATTPLYSTLLGARIDGTELDARYWARNLREPVRLLASLRAAIDAGIGAFVELGPHPALREPIRQTLQRPGRGVRYVHSLRRDEGDRDELLRNAAALYTMGYRLDWSALCEPGPQAELPAYPWRHRRHWFDTDGAPPAAARTADLATRLAAHPAIAAAACHDAPEPSGDTRRGAEVVVRAGHTVDAFELRRWLRPWFESRDLPVAWRFVDELPGGPAPAEPPPPLPPDVFGELAGLHAPPRNATESALIELWTETLGIPKLGIASSFFALGGTSLLAIRISSRVCERFDVSIPPRRLFADPTVAGMASLVEEARRERAQLPADLSPRAAPARQRAPVPGEAHAASIYEEMIWSWFAELVDYAVPFFPLHQHRVFRLAGPLDHGALERSFDEVIRRSDPLRATFRVEAHRLRRRIAAPTPFRLPVIDLRDVPEPERRDRALTRVLELILAPFDHARGPLVRAAILQLAEDDCLLCYSLSHMVCDGYSTYVLFVEELVAVYNAFAAGRPSPLPSPAPDDAEPRDPSAAQLQAAIEFWTARLAGARPVQLAGDLDRAPVDAKWRDRHLPGSPIGWLTVPRLPPELLAGIKALMRQESLTLFELMLVPFMMLLKRGSGQDDICVFSARLNRSPAQYSVHGTRVNPVILRLQLPDARTFRAALRESGPMVEAATTHEQLTLLVIPEALGSDTYPPIQMAIPKLASSQLFRINFNYLPHPHPPAFDQLSATLESMVPRIPDCHSPWDLVLYVAAEDGALLGYNRQLFTAPAARRFATDYVALLARVVANPDAPLATLLAF